MANPNSPPPVLDGARLLAYAVIDGSVTYTSKSTLYVDGKLLGAVPRLAVCQSPDDESALLLFCDKKWNTLGVVECASMAEAQQRAESEYQGVSKSWVNVSVSEEEAARYMEEQYKEQRCSFCGKSPNDVQQMFAASTACICDSCVRGFYRDLAQ